MDFGGWPLTNRSFTDPQALPGTAEHFEHFFEKTGSIKSEDHAIS